MRTLRHAGAEIETLAPHPGLPDLVFTANLGLVDGDTCIAARMRHPERRDEPAHAETWFREHGYGVHHLGEDVVQEGAGDGLPFEGTLVGGYRTRSSASSYIGYREHVVKKGDTLTKIAKKHNVGVDSG